MAGPETIKELCLDCALCIMAGSNITLSLQPGAKWPAGFPRGELLSVNQAGVTNASFDPLKVLGWVQKRTRAMRGGE